MLTSIRSFALIAAIGLVSCSNPAGEEPVTLSPGRYQISMSGVPTGGASLANASAARDEKSVCMLPDDATTFTDHPLAEVPSIGNCSYREAKRTGNAFSGTKTCSATQGPMSMNSTAAYEGSLRADGFDLSGQLEMIAEPEIDGLKDIRVKFEVSGQRTGDC